MAAAIVLIPLGFVGPSIVAFHEIKIITGSAVIGMAAGAVAAVILAIVVTQLTSNVIPVAAILAIIWMVIRGRRFRNL